jgi:hypothetical protein
LKLAKASVAKLNVPRMIPLYVGDAASRQKARSLVEARRHLLVGWAELPGAALHAIERRAVALGISRIAALRLATTAGRCPRRGSAGRGARPSPATASCGPRASCVQG